MIIDTILSQFHLFSVPTIQLHKISINIILPSPALSLVTCCLAGLICTASMFNEQRACWVWHLPSSQKKAFLAPSANMVRTNLILTAIFLSETHGANVNANGNSGDSCTPCRHTKWLEWRFASYLRNATVLGSVRCMYHVWAMRGSVISVQNVQLLDNLSGRKSCWQARGRQRSV